MYHAFFVALLHLLPAKATPVSELGACAFVVFVVYTSWFENYLVKRPGQIMLRLANAPNVWPLELLGVLLLIFTVYVACAFSFGLSSPIALPSWACRSCFDVHFQTRLVCLCSTSLAGRQHSSSRGL